MRKLLRIILVVGLVLIVSSVTSALIQKQVNHPVAVVPPPTVDGLFTLVNQERAKVGAPPLVIDPRLNRSAQMKADDMFNNNYFGHENPTTGKHGVDYMPIKEMGCIGGSGGENLLQYAKSTEDGVNWWMSSPPHRNAMLAKDTEYVGYAIKGDYIVMHLCDVK